MRSCQTLQARLDNSDDQEGISEKQLLLPLKNELVDDSSASRSGRTAAGAVASKFIKKTGFRRAYGQVEA